MFKVGTQIFYINLNNAEKSQAAIDEWYAQFRTITVKGTKLTTMHSSVAILTINYSGYKHD